jgi:DNA polymerase III delta subunit
MTVKKPTPPGSLFAVSGSLYHLRRRYLQGIISKNISQGWRIDYVDGKNVGELRRALSVSGGVFFEGGTLIVVTNPEKADLELLEQHRDSGDRETILLLDYDGEPKGNTKFGKFLDGLGVHHRSFSIPSEPWKLETAAVDFCVAEAKHHGKTLDSGLAKSLIDRAGTDFGFLAFEIQKMAMLADVDHSDTITVKHIKEGMALVSHALAFPVVEALASRNKVKLAQALSRVRQTSKDNPTMGICRLIGASVLKWLEVVDLFRRGLGSEEVAAKLEMNPWYLKNKMAPQIAKWDWRGICRIVQALAESERAVLNGQIDAWIGLTARLLEVCG